MRQGDVQVEQFPRTVLHEALSQWSPGYRDDENSYYDHSLREAEFHFTPGYPLHDLGRHAATPDDLIESVDYDDGAEREDDRSTYRDLHHQIGTEPRRTAPIIVDEHHGGLAKAPILDGNHRTALALDQGITHLPAYVRTRDG